MGILDPDSSGEPRPGPHDIWRTWLMTGARTHPIDRRRLQGEHRGLKEILAEGDEPDAMRRPWRDFSRAMVRQSLNEAMNGLSARERVVITMAYFAGFSNEEIAEELGMTERGVQRSLRRALDRLSDMLERGRRIALNVLLALAGGRLARWFSDNATPATSHAVAVAAIVAVFAVGPAASTAQHHEARLGPMLATPAVAAKAASKQSTAPGAPSTALSLGSPPVGAPPVSVPSITSGNPLPPLPKIKIPKLPLPRSL